MARKKSEENLVKSLDEVAKKAEETESTSTEQVESTSSTEDTTKEEVVSEPSTESTATKPARRKDYTHIDVFIDSIQPKYNLTSLQRKGFRVYMKGNHYSLDESYFEKELKRYLGK